MPNPLRITPISVGPDYIRFDAINYEASAILIDKQVNTTGKGVLLVQIPGRSCWIGRGTYEYSSPLYQVWLMGEKLETTSKNSVRYQCHKIYEGEATRATGKEIRATARQIFNNEAAKLEVVK